MLIAKPQVERAKLEIEPIEFKIKPKEQPVIHSPQLIFLKNTKSHEKTPKKPKKKKNLKHFDRTILLGGKNRDENSSSDENLEVEIPKMKTQKKSPKSTKKAKKALKNYDPNESYDVVIESVTYV